MKSKPSRQILGLLFPILLGATPLAADFLYIPVAADALIASGGGWESASSGSQPYSMIDALGADWNAALFQFDLSALPRGTVVEEAWLDIFHVFNQQNGQTFSVYRNLSSWSEAVVMGSRAPAYDPVAVAQETVTDSTAGLWRSWRIGAEPVNSWLAQPRLNFGLRVERPADAATPWPYFAGREGGSITQSILRVEYRVDPYSSPVPEPSAVICCGMGLVAITLRRRFTFMTR